MTKVYISGTQNLTELPKAATEAIDNINNLGYTILIGDRDGLDSLVQAYLKTLEYSYSYVMVYSKKYPKNNLGFNITRLAYAKNDEEVQEEMAEMADFGLAIIKDEADLAMFQKYSLKTKVILINSQSSDLGKAGLVFNLFPDEIKEESKKKPKILIPEIILFNCNKPGMAFKTAQPNIIGKEYKIRAVMALIKGKEHNFLQAELEGEFKIIGAINDKYANYVPLGEVRTMELFVFKPYCVVLSPYSTTPNKICEHEYYDKDGVLKVGWLRKALSWAGGPSAIVLWDKSLVPELQGTPCDRAKFVFTKQTIQFPTGMDWKYHPKTWCKANFPELADDSDDN